jgi:hypothetical protein
MLLWTILSGIFDLTIGRGDFPGLDKGIPFAGWNINFFFKSWR